jgi:hypothetical protein
MHHVHKMGRTYHYVLFSYSESFLTNIILKQE